MGQLILYSLLAGVVGTGLGGFISVSLKKRNKKVMTYMLNFAGGMMISITCFKLIPESVELGGIFVATAGVLIGVVFIQVLNSYIDKVQSRKQCDIPHKEIEELIHAEALIKEEAHSQLHKQQGDYNDACIFRAGLIMLFAIALHNFPEGLAIGSTGAYNVQIGLILAVTIAFHNVPEGMAIAVPLNIGGLSKFKSVLWTALSGATTVVGAILGFLIGGISDSIASLALAFAGGAMVYVTFGEIIPQAILMCNNRKSIGYMILGFVIAMVVMFLT